MHCLREVLSSPKHLCWLYAYTQPSDVRECLLLPPGKAWSPARTRTGKEGKVQELRREARNILMLSVLSFELGLICEGNGVLIGGTL